MSIRIDGYSGTTMTMTWTPETNEVTATLHLITYSTGAETTQALTSGSNSVTIVQSTLYMMVVSGYDSGGLLVGFSNFIFEQTPSSGEGTDYTVYWETDYDVTQQSVGLDINDTRNRIPTNRRGHHFQWELKHHGQNQSIVIKNTELSVRVAGRAYGGRQ